MNFLDRAIGAVAPRLARQRVRNRVALELTQDYLERHAQRFRYEGATAGRRAHGWYAASTDANVELMGSLTWLRNRSRDLIRNNPYAARAIEELAGNVVGIRINARVLGFWDVQPGRLAVIGSLGPADSATQQGKSKRLLSYALLSSDTRS